MPRRDDEETSALIRFEGGASDKSGNAAEDMMANCCSCCPTEACCGAKCISISLVLLMIVQSFVYLTYDIYLASMNEHMGNEVQSVYGVALAPAIVAIVLFAYWLCCAEDQVEQGWALTTSFWASFAALFVYVFWTVIYFTCIWEDEDVKVYAGANDDGEAQYNDEGVGTYICIRIVFPIVILIAAGVLYCSVVAPFAHGDGASKDDESE